MSEIVKKFARRMAENLEARARNPSTDIWPSPLADLTLVNDITSDYILHLIESMYNSDNSADLVAESFYRPSRLVYFLYLFAVTPKSKDDVEHRLSLAEKMLGSISYLRCNDPFIDNGVNKVINYENYLKKITLTPINEEAQAILKRIIVALAVINEYLYYAWVGLGREVHGPYNVDSQRILVTEYYDMKSPIWSDFSDKLKFSNYVICTDMESSFTPRFDINGRMYYGGRRNYSSACIIVDGAMCPNSVEVLTDIYDNLHKTINAAKEFVRPLSGSELLLHFAKVQNYIVKQSADKLGVKVPSCLPLEIEHEILTTSKRSTIYCMNKKLNLAKDRESRIRIIQDYIMPMY